MTPVGITVDESLDVDLCGSPAIDDRDESLRILYDPSLEDAAPFVPRAFD